MYPNHHDFVGNRQQRSALEDAGSLLDNLQKCLSRVALMLEQDPLTSPFPHLFLNVTQPYSAVKRLLIK